MTSKELARESDEAIRRLRAMLKPGDTVYTTVTHVSRSGMSRNIRAFAISDNEPSDISWLVAHATGRKLADDGGVKCGGAGMDMGFDLVYSLAQALFPDGFDCISDPSNPRAPFDCPSNDHSNREHNAHHRSGGYALVQRWL